MKGYTKLPKKQLYLILVPLGILIFTLSLEVLMNVKDYALFEKWMNNWTDHQGMTEDELFNVYVSGNMSLYFIKIIIPIGLSVHSYFAYIKIRINQLFVFMWTILIIGSAFYTLGTINFNSIFTYVYLLIYGIVVFTILSLSSVISKNEKQ